MKMSQGPTVYFKKFSGKVPRIHFFLTAEPSDGYKVLAFGLNKASALNTSTAIKTIHRL